MAHNVIEQFGDTSRLSFSDFPHENGESNWGTERYNAGRAIRGPICRCVRAARNLIHNSPGDWKTFPTEHRGRSSLDLRSLARNDFYFDVRSFSEKSLTGGDEVEDAGLGLRAQLVARPTEDGPVIPSGVEAVDELRLREREMENRADDSRGTHGAPPSLKSILQPDLGSVTLGCENHGANLHHNARKPRVADPESVSVSNSPGRWSRRS